MDYLREQPDFIAETRCYFCNEICGIGKACPHCEMPEPGPDRIIDKPF